MPFECVTTGTIPTTAGDFFRAKKDLKCPFRQNRRSTRGPVWRKRWCLHPSDVATVTAFRADTRTFNNPQTYLTYPEKHSLTKNIYTFLCLWYSPWVLKKAWAAVFPKWYFEFYSWFNDIIKNIISLQQNNYFASSKSELKWIKSNVKQNEESCILKGFSRKASRLGTILFCTEESCRIVKNIILQPWYINFEIHFLSNNDDGLEIS